MVVDTDERLSSFLSALKAAPWIALDTEADSLHAYPEKVCLIQISTPTGDRVVDPLAGVNLAPLFRALAQRELIMHGADYDLRLLRKHHEFVPHAIFDTMLAARLLGLKQFSLGHLVERYLGVKLEKGPQKANWAIRPLTLRMEIYARNDTHYLKPLSDRMRTELEVKARLQWHHEYCAQLVAESSAEQGPDPDNTWRLKGSQLLDRAGLAVLREVWKWREKEAISANRPPFFVVSHDALVDMAAAASAAKPLEPLLPRHLSERRRAGLLKAATHGLQLPPDHQPRILKHTTRRPTEGEKRRYHEIQRRRDQQAAKLGIDPTVIASRAVISQLAHDWDKYSKELMIWQQELLKPDGAAA